VAKIKDFLPGRKESVGRTAVDNRVFVNGVLGVAFRGALARSPSATASTKLTSASSAGRAVAFGRGSFTSLVRDRKNHYLMLDPPSCAPHSKRPRAAKKGLGQGSWGVPEEA